jgi:hypothetical protein
VADANGWRLSSCVDRRTGASIRLDLPGVAAVTAAPMQAAAP